MMVIRTVRGGRVRINGRDYAPDARHMAYDGRLEGRRFAFGTYLSRPGLACLWGTEEAYRGRGAVSDGPHVVDGRLPWTFWREQPTAKEEA